MPRKGGKTFPELHETTDIGAMVIDDEVVSAMERTASQGDFRANLSRSNERSINLSDAETEMCVKTANAVGLELAGVDLIREKMGQTYVTEVNGNPGTGIIDVTGKNYFVDLISHIETRAKKNETVIAPVPLPNEGEEEKQRQENEEESSVKKYKELVSKEKSDTISYNENVLLSFLKRKIART